MASQYLHFDVKGLAQLQKNLASFGDERIVGRIIRAALQAGGRVARPRGVSNARAIGMGFSGMKTYPDGRKEMRYGRIPRSIKVGRAYIPRNNRNEYRVNVSARGQRVAGIYSNRAPHAHLIEYGWRHFGGKVIGPRPFLGPALQQTAPEVIEKIRTNMAGRIEKLKFPQ